MRNLWVRMMAALAGLAALARLSTASPPPLPRPLAFRHVTVIDGTGARPRPDQTVQITGSRITAVGPARRIQVSLGAQTVDATGQYLIPGLWDMHVHVGSGAKFYLPLFIANGVTGIRIMSGLPEHHRWRREVEAGAIAGPRMVIASAIIDGPKTFFPDHVRVSNADEARAAVRKARQEGADFIKIHDLVPRAAYFALIDEARRQGLPVAGHLPVSIAPGEAAAAGQTTIEHLTRLDDLSFSGSGRRQSLALLARFKRSRTWQCPTLVMTHHYAWLDDPSLLGDPRVKYVRPDVSESWKGYKDPRLSAQDWAGRKQIFRKKQAIVREMQQAGVGILAGTDLGNPYLFPGFSLHDELALLVEAGMTPMEALQAATRNPARLLGREKEFGTIQPGQRADLLLLAADPLADIHNTRVIQAVVAGGRFYDRAALDQLLAAAEAAATKAE